MNMQGLFAKHGRSVRIRQPDGSLAAPYHAFIQPLRYKNKMYLYGVNTEIGYNNQGYYLYLGPPEQDVRALAQDSYIQTRDCAYQVDRAEAVYHGDALLYIWAILRTVVE